MLSLQQAEKIGTPVNETGFWTLKSGSFYPEFTTKKLKYSIPVAPGDIIVHRPGAAFEVPEGYEIKGWNNVDGSRQYPTRYNNAEIGTPRRGPKGAWFVTDLILTPTV